MSEATNEALDAAQRHEARARRAHHEATRATLDAREAMNARRDVATRAEHIANDAREAFDAAHSKASDAEAAWMAEQTPERWEVLTGARAMRDQSELRARAAEASALEARRDLARAESATRAAEAAEVSAALELRSAEDIRAGHERSVRRLADEEAARIGYQERLRRDASDAGERWQHEALEALVPALVEYLDALSTLRAAEARLSTLADALAPRGRAMADAISPGWSVCPPVHYEVLPGPVLAALAAERAFPRELERGRVVAEAWGRAPLAHTSGVRSDTVYGKHLALDAVSAALRASKASRPR